MFMHVCAGCKDFCLTDNGGEASCGFLPRDQLVQVRVVKFQTLQEGHVPPLAFSVEDVK